MTWTAKQKLDALMRVPWSVFEERNDEQGYLVAQVRELPDAIATGADERTLARDIYAAVRASLACRLEFGDDIPLPPGYLLPWSNGAAPPMETKVISVVLSRRGVTLTSTGEGKQYDNLVHA